MQTGNRLQGHTPTSQTNFTACSSESETWNYYETWTPVKHITSFAETDVVTLRKLQSALCLQEAGH